MGTLTTIIIISVIIVICVAGITIIQKREQEKARIRQLIAKYRYRANETANILSNFAKTPIGTEARSLMLSYIQLNLAQAVKLAPDDGNLNSSLETIKEQAKNPSSPVDSQRLVIPTDPTQLSLLISQLSKLGKYLLRFKAVPSLDSNQIAVAVSKLSLLISEAKICAYIQQGQSALAKHDYVRAQGLFQTAQQMLDKFTNKNSRLTALETELQELINLTPSQAANKTLSLEETPQESEQKADSSPEVTDIFGPKKKW